MPACRPFALRFVLAPLLALAAGLEAPREAAAQDGMPSRLRFEVRYARDLHEGPLTGRLFLAFSPTEEPEPRIRIYNPEMDQFYLSYAVYLLEEFLEGTTDPHYGGEVVHGRPMKGHLWSPFTNAELVRRMAAHVAANAPPDASNAWYERP